jgi:hypothetical protein
MPEARSRYIRSKNFEQEIDMNISIDDYVSGGYFITQFVDSASSNRWLRNVIGATEDLLPDRILSSGYCSAENAPVFSWAGNGTEEYARFGIAPDRISEVDTWANASLGRETGHPDLFLHLRTAREYIRRFVTEKNDNQLLGIALHKERLRQITELERLRPPQVAPSGVKISGFEGTGFAKALHLGEPPLSGEILGFDIICCFANIDHSWLCNGLVVDGLNEFNFRPNQFGLIDQKTDADKLADYAATIPTEEGIWLPVLVTRYPLIL